MARQVKTPTQQQPEGSSEDAPMIKAYSKDKPYIIQDGLNMFELDLITGRVRAAEWQDVFVKLKTKTPFRIKVKKLLALLHLGKPLPKQKPVKQLVEYDACLYIPAQTLKSAKTQFDRMMRMSNAKGVIKIK